MSRITVVGGGYVGLVTSACMAYLGHVVTCLESDPSKVSSLRAGVLPISEPGLAEIWSSQTRSKRLSITDDSGEALGDAQYVFVAVGTPQSDDGSADLSFLKTAVGTVLRHSPQNAVICIKSTVPPGTCASIEDAIQHPDGTGRARRRIVSSPEFLSQGRAVRDFLAPDRVVIGSSDTATGARVASLFSDLATPVVVMEQTAAELVKYASNAFLAMKISFVNEMAGLAEQLGTDIGDVSQAVGLDRRIGPRFLEAGIGWGGSCFPKDTAALSGLMKSVGVSPRLIDATREVNSGQVEHLAAKVAQLVGQRRGARIAVLGLAFKPGTDDIRGSQSVSLIRRLLQRGYDLTAYDPATTSLPADVVDRVSLCESVFDAVADAAAVVVATPWPEFVDLDYQALARQMKQRVVIDARRSLDPQALIDAGFAYYRPGDGRISRSTGLIDHEHDEAAAPRTSRATASQIRGPDFTFGRQLRPQRSITT